MRDDYQSEARALARSLAELGKQRGGPIVTAQVTDISNLTTLGFVIVSMGNSPVRVLTRTMEDIRVNDWIFCRQMSPDKAAPWVYVSFCKQGDGTTSPRWRASAHNLNFVFDGGGEAIAPGTYGPMYLDFAGTVTACHLFADQVGFLVVDVQRMFLAGATPEDCGYPTDFLSICSGAPPTLGDGDHPAGQQVMLNWDIVNLGWDTEIRLQTLYQFVVQAEPVPTVTRCTLSMEIER